MTIFFTRMLISTMLFLPCFISHSSAQSNVTKTIQNSFVIHGQLTNEQITFYTKSILAADLEQFRLKNQTVTLKFKNGFLLELTSAKELMLKNTNATININNYSDHAASVNYKYPIFEVLNSGALTAEIQNDKK